jgi:hypothetical protein
MERKPNDDALRELLLQGLIEEARQRKQYKPPEGAERRREWNVLTQYRHLFTTAGIAVLSVFLSSFVILLIFLITCMIFHIDVARYFPF